MAAVINTFTDTISVSYTGNGKAVSSPIGTYSGAKDAGVATVIAAGATNLLISINFTYLNIQAVIMTSDQALTVKTNSSTTPINTFSIKPTSAMIWATDFASTNPFTADVTAFYVTNSGATDAKFSFRVLYN